MNSKNFTRIFIILITIFILKKEEYNLANEQLKKKITDLYFTTELK